MKRPKQSRRRKQPETVRISITLTKQVHGYLKSLVDLGLYGATTAEAAVQLICEGLRNDLRSKRKALLDR